MWFAWTRQLMALPLGKVGHFSKTHKNKLRREYTNQPLIHKQFKCGLQNNSSMKPLEKKLPQSTIFFIFKERCNSLERPSDLIREKTVPQLDNTVVANINSAKHPIENIVLLLQVVQWLFSRSALPQASMLHWRLYCKSQSPQWASNLPALCWGLFVSNFIQSKNHGYHDLVS